jgi:hypothetical protein
VFEGQIALHHFHDIVCLADLVDKMVVQQMLTTVTPLPPSEGGGVSVLITCFLRRR